MRVFLHSRKQYFELNISEELISQFDYNTFKANSPFYTFNDKQFRYIRDIILGEEKYVQLMYRMMSIYNYDVEANRKHLWMNTNNLIMIDQEGNKIGLPSHSHSHPTMLGKMSYEEQLSEFKMKKSP